MGKTLVVLSARTPDLGSREKGGGSVRTRCRGLEDGVHTDVCAFSKKQVLGLYENLNDP